jgi:5-formyltetrahydrofolate cyclo-ligase
MKKGNRLILKTDLRKKFLVLRAAIPPERRSSASLLIARLLQTKGRILSFYSIGSEIDLSLTNSLLAQSGRLMGLRLEGGSLVPYHIRDERELVVSDLGIPEPNPKTSEKASLSEIDLILVPGLAFDSAGNRLGYGKGHYDQFLASAGEIPTAGIGFREQLFSMLPRDPWDVPVRELILV